tara:strand:+ start:3336 stop:3710 length:375 start_codon:yes stop_codon:yes gene_type:complete
MAKSSSEFDFSKYQIKTGTKKQTLIIEETGDEFEVTIKQLSWVKRNQLISKCLRVGGQGEQSFDGDLYIKECLKQMVVEAPWGPTSESFLISIDERLGKALEALVPSAFGSDEGGTNPDEIKKE